ncbi:MAG: hypothetical protein AAFY71_00355 [Bacteroidota bacterium]
MGLISLAPDISSILIYILILGVPILLVKLTVDWLSATENRYERLRKALIWGGLIHFLLAIISAIISLPSTNLSLACSIVLASCIIGIVLLDNKQAFKANDQ